MAFIVSTLLTSSSIQESCHSVCVAFCAARYENAATRVPLSRSARTGLRARKNRTAVRVARVLTEFRERRKLSIEQLSARAKITVTRLEKFEAGERAPYLDELFRLAVAFRVRPSYIARRIDRATSGTRASA